MSEKRPGRYRQAFFAGLATLLPTVLTLFILTFCYNFLDQKVAQPITGALEDALKTGTAKEYYWRGLWNLQEEQLDDTVDASFPDDRPFEERVEDHVPNWIGFVIGLVLVFGVGFLFRGYIGRQTIRLLESWMLRIPLIKVIYPYAKQVTEFFFREKKALTYQSCVAVEYPRLGIYQLGFITSEGFREVSDLAGGDVVTVFMPSSPTPFTGYTILVPRKSVTPLSLSVDEALRFVISGGVILPPSQMPPLALKTRRLESPPSGASTPGGAEAAGDS